MDSTLTLGPCNRIKRDKNPINYNVFQYFKSLQKGKKPNTLDSANIEPTRAAKVIYIDLFNSFIL